jgi:hypothetical protein
VGSNGAVTAGIEWYSSAAFNSDSQSSYLTGTQVVDDPEGRPAYTATFSQSSIVTTSLSSTDNRTLTLGAAGAVLGGVDSFTFIQNNSDSHSLTASGDNDDVSDIGSDWYSLSMSGLETLGAGGAVSGGSDWFDWQQDTSDAYTLSRHLDSLA